MIFEEKTIILKDGRTAILKSPCVEDAEKLLNYIKKSCSETDFLARYPEEWTTTIGQEEAWVNRLRSAPDTLGITCYVDGEDAGNCEISFRGDMKVSHRATIANAILKDYWNLGIGSAMFEELVSAAQNRGTEINLRPRIDAQTDDHCARRYFQDNDGFGNCQFIFNSIAAKHY